MAVMIDKETKEAVPVTAFLNGEQLAKDIAKVNDAARGRFLSVTGMALALMKNYDPFKSPTHFKLIDLMKKFDKTFGATGKNYGKVDKDAHAARTSRCAARIAGTSCSSPGMWFQDLFNYDFRRTERCIIPYATQQGEISFCAYNTGIGWRQHHREDAHDGHADQVVRGARPSRDLRRRQEGRARRPQAHTLVLDAEAVAKGKQTDLDDKGIAKNAREEKLRARDEMKKKAENDRMARLYRQHVLKEAKPQEVAGLQIQGLKKPAARRTTRPSRSRTH